MSPGLLSIGGPEVLIGRAFLEPKFLTQSRDRVGDLVQPFSNAMTVDGPRGCCRTAIATVLGLGSSTIERRTTDGAWSPGNRAFGFCGASDERSGYGHVLPFPVTVPVDGRASRVASAAIPCAQVVTESLGARDANI